MAKIVVYYSVYNAPNPFRNIQKRSLACKELGILHVTHYGLRSGFQYCDLTPTPHPQSRRPTYPPLKDALWA